jgi:hypothetical protein
LAAKQVETKIDTWHSAFDILLCSQLPMSQQGLHGRNLRLTSPLSRVTRSPVEQMSSPTVAEYAS